MTNQDTTTTCTYVNESAYAHSVFFFSETLSALDCSVGKSDQSQGRKKKIIFLSIQNKIKWTYLRSYKVA